MPSSHHEPELEHGDLDHVARPGLPWRDAVMTECGLPDAPGRRIISRDTFHAKVRRQGKTRSSMTTCMTCWDAASRWKDWAQAPSEVMRREVLNTRYNRPGYGPLDSELRAIEALVQAHRAEFDGYLDGLRMTYDIAVLRETRRRRIVGEHRWTL